MMFRREIFHNHGQEVRLDVRAQRAQDTNLMFRLAAFGHRFAPLNEVTYFYAADTHNRRQRIAHRIKSTEANVRTNHEYVHNPFRRFIYDCMILAVSLSKITWEIFFKNNVIK